MNRHALLRSWPHVTVREVDERKRDAIRIYNNALRKGELIRQPCERCGDPKSEGHHPDYGQPLQVVWLCRPHHRAWHRERQPVTTLQRGRPKPLPRPTRAEGQLVNAITRDFDRLMEREGINRSQLADLVGISRQSVANQFCGGIRTFSMLARLAHVLGYRVVVTFVKSSADPQN